MRAALAAALLTACAATPEASDVWIAPLDGQTDVVQTAALQVRAEGLQIPPDYPLPADFVRVLDLDAEDPGFLPGVVTFDGEEIRFEPDGGWLAGHAYAWSVGELAAMDRAPEFGLPEAISGEAVFATSQALEVLDFAKDEQDRVCALLSRFVDTVDGDVRITVDDEDREPGVVTLQPETDWVTDRALDPGDAGVSVACFDGLIGLDLGPGATVRLWWGEDGPWFGVLDEQRSISDAITDHRRPR